MLQGFAGTFLFLFSLRLLLGIFEAPAFPICNRLVDDVVSGSRTRGRHRVLHLRAICRPRLPDAAARADAKTSGLALRVYFHRRARLGVGGNLVMRSIATRPRSRLMNAAEINYIRAGGGLAESTAASNFASTLFLGGSQQNSFAPEIVGHLPRPIRGDVDDVVFSHVVSDAIS